MAAYSRVEVRALRCRRCLIVDIASASACSLLVRGALHRRRHPLHDPACVSYNLSYKQMFAQGLPQAPGCHRRRTSCMLVFVQWTVGGRGDWMGEEETRERWQGCATPCSWSPSSSPSRRSVACVPAAFRKAACLWNSSLSRCGCSLQEQRRQRHQQHTLQGTLSEVRQCPC